MTVLEIPRELLEDFWPLISGFLDRALVHHPFLELAGLEQLVKDARATLFVLREGERLIGAFVLEALDYPHVRVGNVVAAGWEGGEFERHAVAVEQHFAAWARALGCRKITMLGRPGWTRFLQREGWHTMPLIASFKDVA